MVNKYLNSMLNQMHKILGCCVGVIEPSGTVASAGGEFSEENISLIISKCIDDQKHIVQMGDYTFCASVARGKAEYIVFVADTGENAQKHAEMLCASVASIRVIHNDKYDKTNFIKNILADSVLPGDVFVKSKELHIAYDMNRIVFALQYDEVRGLDVFDIVSGIFPDNGKDFVVDLDNNTIVIVREAKDNIKDGETELLARQIIDTITTEALVNVKIGVGTIAANIKDIAKSYKEARIALEVGKVFDEDKYIISYDNLGIARLIYQLPTTLCELFLSEVFKKESIDSLDSETLYTIQMFFDNNLNISETSRQLYVHRNTLVYRLDKVRKITGLDLRIFDHAIVFKVALMVKKYLTSKPMRI
ncbi:MAG: helix-turn-helix domain-containing protein [Clostridia bacterium]|nr:helix-turn-helix domain-containing protein [Clostridia bacterium]